LSKSVFVSLVEGVHRKRTDVALFDVACKLVGGCGFSVGMIGLSESSSQAENANIAANNTINKLLNFIKTSFLFYFKYEITKIYFKKTNFK